MCSEGTEIYICPECNAEYDEVDDLMACLEDHLDN